MCDELSIPTIYP